MSDDKPANIPDTESMAQLPPRVPATALPAEIAASAAPARDKLLDACHATLASVGASQRAVASEAASMALELDTMARATLSATGDGVTALLRSTSLTEAVEVQLALTRRHLEAIAASSARLGELGLRLFVGASQPFLDAARQSEGGSI